VPGDLRIVGVVTSLECIAIACSSQFIMSAAASQIRARRTKGVLEDQDDNTDVNTQAYSHNNPSEAAAAAAAAAVGRPFNSAPYKFLHNLLFNRAYFDYFFWLVLVGEFLLGLLIISRVSYTEIDWVAYMQEVGGYLNGELDYTKLKGDTGPLVYPAGFVWAYSVLYYITNEGKNILLAQYIFLGIYLLNLAIVLRLYYATSRIPNWVMLLLCCSKRIHSIYMLRCFNDCIAMLFLYLAIYVLQRNKQLAASLLFSLALSIKMNILLFLPSFGILLLQSTTVFHTFLYVSVLIFFQFVVGYPFILYNSASYFGRAFEFSRQFNYIWTVNWKFLSEEAFASKFLALSLLFLHFALLVVFLQRFTLGGGITGVIKTAIVQFLRCSWAKRPQLSPDYCVKLLFISNFIGICCSRSLHYQFYSWYFHTLPYLLWLTGFPVALQLILFFVIEIVWNIYPAQALSSLLLQLCHILLLIGLFINSQQAKETTKIVKRIEENREINDLLQQYLGN
jgi:alpha-1,3-mannosyltransferase